MHERGSSKSNTPASSILAISATSMREGFVLYDQDGQEIWACANVDGRASAEVSELKEIRSHLEKIYIQSLVKLFIRCFTRLLWIKNMNLTSIILFTLLQC